MLLLQSGGDSHVVWQRSSWSCPAADGDGVGTAQQMCDLCAWTCTCWTAWWIFHEGTVKKNRLDLTTLSDCVFSMYYLEETQKRRDDKKVLLHYRGDLSFNLCVIFQVTLSRTCMVNRTRSYIAKKKLQQNGKKKNVPNFFWLFSLLLCQLFIH